MPVEEGAKLTESEWVYRAIPPACWLDSENRVTSAAFSSIPFSVDIKCMTTEADALGRRSAGSGLSELSMRYLATKLGMQAMQKTEHGNIAHANVYVDREVHGKRTLKRKLAEHATEHLLRQPAKSP